MVIQFPCWDRYETPIRVGAGAVAKARVESTQCPYSAWRDVRGAFIVRA